MQNMVPYLNLLKGGIWTMQFFIFRKFTGYRKWISLVVTFCLIVTLCPVGLFSTAEASNVEITTPSKRELTAQRTAISKRFDNGDGSFTEQIYFQPIHRKQENRWEEISAKLMQPTTSGEIVTQQTELGIQFAPRMERGKYLTLQRGSHKLSYTFLAAEGDTVKTQPVHVAPIFTMNRILYKNVIPGIHLRNVAFDTSVKEDIMLEKYTGYYQFRFQVDTDLMAKKQIDGSVIFFDAKGTEIFKLPKPYMQDSNVDPKSGEASRSENVTYQVEREAKSWILTVVADQEWLKSPARQYPVYIDPTTTVGVSGDTFVSSAYSTTNYQGFWDANLGFYSLKVGYYDSSSGTNYAYVKPNLSSLSGMVVDSATLHMYAGHSYDPAAPTPVWLDTVNADWNTSTLTWNNKPASTSLSTMKVHKGQWAGFDVTGTVRAWVGGEKSNYGFKLHENGNGQTHWKKFYASGNSTNQPYLAVTYHPRTEELGTEDFWMYVPVPGGKVYTGNGNLVVQDEDFEISGRGPAVSVERTYNSLSTQDGVFGLGWSWDFGMTVKADARGTIWYSDEDGTIHPFTKKSDDTYQHPPGVYLEMSKSATGYTVRNKDQIQYLFNSSGKLTQIVDADNNKLTLAYNASNQLITVTDASGRVVSFSYNSTGKIATIQDPAHRKWTYGYSGNLLTSITDPEGGVAQYEYTNHMLTGVKDPNHTEEKSAETVYTYTNKQVTSVKDPLNRTSTLAYDSIHRQVTLTEPNGSITQYVYNRFGNPAKMVGDPTGLNLVTTYTYDQNNLLETKDPNANKTGQGQATESYRYDSEGNIIQAKDASGTETYQYNGNNDVIRYTDANNQSYQSTYDGTQEVSTTDPAKVSSAKKYNAVGNVISSTKELGMADNLVINPGMERMSGNLPQNWAKSIVGDNGAISSDTTQKKWGIRSVRVTSKSTANGLGYVAAVQEVSVQPNTTYTLSSSIKTSNLNKAYAFLNTEQLDKNGKPVSTNRWADNRHSKRTGTQDWTERQVTFTTGATTTEVRIYLEIDHTQSTAAGGTAWFDNVQLETGVVSTRYNPLENSSFERDFSNWSSSSGTATVDSVESFSGAKSLKMARSATTDSAMQYRQDFALNQAIAAPITITGMSKASGIKNTVNNESNPDYSIWVDAVQSDGTYATNQATFSLGTHDWQRAAVTLNPSKPIQTVHVYVLFRGKNTGTVWFDNVRIQAGGVITAYQYDGKGNEVTQTTDPTGNSTQSTYDEVGNQLTTIDAKGNAKRWTYDLLNRMKSIALPGADVKVQYIHDKNGNIIEKKVTDKESSGVYNTTTYTYDSANQLTSTTDALGKVTRYMYDSNGNLAEITHPNGSTQGYTYDKADRKIEAKQNGKARYRFTYDANGNQTKVEDLSLNVTKTHNFDKTNRMIGMTTSAGTVTWNMDGNDNLKEQKITQTARTYTHTYIYNKVDQNTQVIDPTGRKAQFDYDENGQLRTLASGNGTGATFLYDDNYQVTHVSIGKSNGSAIALYEYLYDQNGNRTSVKDHTGKVISYTYDEQDQLTSETDPISGNTIHYTYDALGNRETKIVKDAAGKVLSTTNYTYNAMNQLTAINDESLNYNENGQLIDNGEIRYDWDAEGRLIQASRKADGSSIAAYDYDEQGRRIRSVVGDVTTNYVYDGTSNRVLYETNASNQMTCYYTYTAGGQLLSMTRVGGETYFYHYNAHGDVITVTDTQQNTVATYTYDAWGNILSQSGSFADENPYRYAGYRYDKETGLYYLMARYYSPQNGNFLSLDPDPGDDDDPQTQNGYNYSNNNPVTMMDPDGKRSFKALGKSLKKAWEYTSKGWDHLKRGYNWVKKKIPYRVSGPDLKRSGRVLGIYKKMKGKDGRIFQIDYHGCVWQVKNT
jgi:RHS repeat-associated protein